MEVLGLAILLLLQIYHCSGSEKCGLVPAKVYLARGEKTQLIFWTDQDNYAVQPVTGGSSTEPLPNQQNVDVFLQAVNGQISVSKGQNIQSYPRFNQTSTLTSTPASSTPSTASSSTRASTTPFSTLGTASTSMDISSSASDLSIDEEVGQPTANVQISIEGSTTFTVMPPEETTFMQDDQEKISAVLPFQNNFTESVATVLPFQVISAEDIGTTTEVNEIPKVSTIETTEVKANEDTTKNNSDNVELTQNDNSVDMESETLGVSTEDIKGDSTTEAIINNQETTTMNMENKDVSQTEDKDMNSDDLTVVTASSETETEQTEVNLNLEASTSDLPLEKEIEKLSETDSTPSTTVSIIDQATTLVIKESYTEIDITENYEIEDEDVTTENNNKIMEDDKEVEIQLSTSSEMSTDSTITVAMLFKDKESQATTVNMDDSEKETLTESSTVKEMSSETGTTVESSQNIIDAEVSTLSMNGVERETTTSETDLEAITETLDGENKIDIESTNILDDDIDDYSSDLHKDHTKIEGIGESMFISNVVPNRVEEISSVEGNTGNVSETMANKEDNEKLEEDVKLNIDIQATKPKVNNKDDKVMTTLIAFIEGENGLSTTKMMEEKSVYESTTNMYSENDMTGASEGDENEESVAINKDILTATGTREVPKNDDGMSTIMVNLGTVADTITESTSSTDNMSTVKVLLETDNVTSMNSDGMESDKIINNQSESEEAILAANGMVTNEFKQTQHSTKLNTWDDLDTFVDVDGPSMTTGSPILKSTLTPSTMTDTTFSTMFLFGLDITENIIEESSEVKNVPVDNQIDTSLTSGLGLERLPVSSGEETTFQSIPEDQPSISPSQATYYPINQAEDSNNINDDYVDNGEEEILDDDPIDYDIKFDQNKVFEETTTAGPINNEDKNSDNEFEIEPVIAEDEENEIQQTYFPVDNVVEFIVTTTGSPIKVSENQNNYIPFEIEPVVAEEDSEENYISDEEIKIEFAETTTGRAEENKNVLEIAAVVAEFEEENAIDIDYENYDFLNENVKDSSNVQYSKTTTGSPNTGILNKKIPNADSMKKDGIESNDKMVLESSDFDESKNKYSIEDDTIKFPENEIDEIAEEVVYYDDPDSTETNVEIEFPELAIVSLEPPAEETTNNMDKDGEMVENAANQEEVPKSNVESKKGVKESEVTKVAANKVNGPLSLDNVVYYDDPEGDTTQSINDLYEDDMEMEDAQTASDNADSSVPDFEKANVAEEVSDEKEDIDIATTTLASPTTVINGFIITQTKFNQQKTDELLTNKIELDRTSGENEISINATGLPIELIETTSEMVMDTTNSHIVKEETSSVNSNSVEMKKTKDPLQETTPMTTAKFRKPSTLPTASTESINKEVAGEENDTTAAEVEDITATTDNDSTVESSTGIITRTDVLEDRVDEVEGGEKRPPSPFPVSDLLSGIYRLIQGYTAPKKEGIEEKEVTDRADLIQPEVVNYQYQSHPLLNVHNSPRIGEQSSSVDVLQNEIFDTSNSNTDPFVQLSAPDLTGLVPEEEQDDSVSYIFPTRVQTDAPKTLSPFNSPALRIQEPPKVLKKDEEDDAEDKEGFGSLNPFKSILPSFFYANQEKNSNVQVAGALPVTVKDSKNRPSVAGRRPQVPAAKAPPRFPIIGNLGSLFQRNQQKPESAGKVNLKKRPRGEPVSIQLPTDLEDDLQSSRQSRLLPGFEPTIVEQELLSNFENEFDPVESLRNPDIKLFKFLESQPLPVQRSFLDRDFRVKRDADDSINCTWTIETEKNLYLLVTFHNLSAPYTVQCQGAYIEVEREKNGFEARWCGNRVTQGGSRPHVIFARSEVRITVFDDGEEGKTLPTGFNADVEVIDLFDARQYTSLRKSNAYSNVRKLTG